VRFLGLHLRDCRRGFLISAAFRGSKFFIQATLPELSAAFFMSPRFWSSGLFMLPDLHDSGQGFSVKVQDVTFSSIWHWANRGPSGVLRQTLSP
jgi:hypothetical protein